MKSAKEILAVLKHLRSEAKGLMDDAGSVPEAVSGEIALLASRLPSLRQRPPMLKTADFQYPRGDRQKLPKPDSTPAAIFERLIDETDLLPIWFLEQGSVVQRSVARVVLTKPHAGFPPGTGWATGFMVAPSLFLTNNHVIPDEDFLKKIRIQFNFQLGPDGVEQPTESFFPVLDGTFQTNAALDYTLVRLRGNPSPANGSGPVEPGQRWGFVQLHDSPTFREQQHFNVIQHPAGRRKEVALQDNEIDELFTNFVLYKADTEPGSSGSPVFDNLWQIVALHHAGGEQDEDGKWLNNEGIRIDSIVTDLRNALAQTGEQSVLAELGI